jgi:hypothetical protein
MSSRLCNFIKLAKKEKHINVENDLFSIRVKNQKIFFDFTNELEHDTITHTQNLFENNDHEMKLP